MHPDLRSAGHAPQFQYRAAVDGLRGIAVLAVLGFHAFPKTVTGGYVGVDVFFVISGFLITSIIARQLRQGAFSFADFYWRRVRRLFPALVIVLAATLALGWLVMLPDEFKRLGKLVGSSSVFMANIALWRESGYFDRAAELKPLLHLWSLGIEEQFYLVWPAILVALWRRRALLLTTVCILVVSSFVLSVLLTYDAPAANFYSPASRFWELGVGCLLALWKDHTHQPSGAPAQARSVSALGNLLPLLGCALIAVSVAAYHADTPFPGWTALPPVLGTLLILLAPEDAWFQRRVLGSRALVGIGLISYALYLWHWPLLAFANILEAGEAPPAALRWAILAVSFVLAWATYRFVELPIRRRRDLRINLRLVTAATAAGIAGATVYLTGGLTQRYDEDVQALLHDTRIDELCLARMGGDPKINYCRTTSPEPPSIVFVGDSRAQAIYEGAESLLAPRHSIMLLGRGGCPPLLNVRIRGYDPNEEECEDVWRSFVNYIGQAKPNVVVIVGNGSFLLSDDDIQLTRGGVHWPESKEEILEHGIRELLRELRKSSRVIYVGEIPTFATSPSCFLREVSLSTTRCAPDRDRAHVEAEVAPYERVLRRAQEHFPDVKLVDSIEAVCTAGMCSQRPADRPIMYSDAIHLSPAGGRVLVENSRLPELISKSIRVADAHSSASVTPQVIGHR